MGDGPQRQDQADREMKVAVLSNVFYCKICDIRCTSEMNLKMHFIGMKHRKHEEALKNVPGRKGEHKNMGSKAFNSVKRKVPAIDAQHCFGSSVFEQHFRDVGIQDPVIGLNYVIEYQSEVSPNPMFFCELCNCGGGFASFMSHVIGCKHRLNYMAKMHPDALQLDGVKLKQSELNALVKEKARYIEKIDGRGRVKVVIEEVPSELSGGNTATKRVPDTYDQSDSRFSHREDFRNNFAQNMNPAGSNFYESRMARSQDGQFDAKFSPRGNYGDMESSYDTRMLCSQDGPLENRFSRSENFGSNFGLHLNRGSSSSYESRIPYSQDYRPSGDTLQDGWRKNVQSEMRDTDWSSENIRDSGDEYRRRELMRGYQNDYTKGFDADDRWMQRESESYRLDTSKNAFTNEELLECLQNFQIFSDSEAEFALKVTQSLTDGLMEYRLKTMNAFEQERRPPLDEEIRQPSGIPDQCSGYESHAPARDSCQRYTGNPTNFRPKYKDGGTWKKTVALHSKSSNRKIGFQSNRKQFKSTTSNTGPTKSKSNVILTPHLLKTIEGMDIKRATKTLAKLSKTNPALKGIKVSFLVDVLVDAGVLTREQT